MRAPRAAVVSLLLGLVAVLAAVGMLRGGAAAQVGSVPARPLNAPAPSSGSTPQPAVTTPPPRAVGTPVTLRLPRLHLTGRVVPVTVGPHGALGVPEDPAVLGWWRIGAAPGSGSGSVVIDGHVDSARFGVGVFARLRDLDVGDRVELTSSTGRVVTYAVTGRRQYAKADLPFEVFDQVLAERLVLITCGGHFDRRTGHYSENVVLYAVPKRPAA